MNRKEIGSVFDRSNRNAMNDNFDYLFNNTGRLVNQLDDLVLESGQSNAEVVQARAGKTTLDARLREMEEYREVVISKEQPSNAHIWFEVL